MNYIRALWMAISTYSILPAPQTVWRQEGMGKVIYFLPLVGIFIGGGLALWGTLAGALGVGTALFAAVAVVWPLFLTGGIHMDGFLDTADALASHQPREKKLAIMKDPHPGAFAILWCVALLLLSFGLYSELERGLGAVSLGFILSRSLCALTALALPKARPGGMLHALTDQTPAPGALAGLSLLALLCMGGMIALEFGPGLGAVLGALAVLVYYLHMTKQEFGGVTGDTAGFFIETCQFGILFGTWMGGFL